MGITYTCKRMASEFIDNGQRVFMLHEVTYEGNVYPHTKHVSTMHIGDLQSTIQKIFHFAAFVEGGMLNSPDKNLTPERYIKSWLNAIKRPYALDANQEINQNFYAFNKERKQQFVHAVQDRQKVSICDTYDLINAYQAYSALPKLFSDNGSSYTEQLPKEYGYKPAKAEPLPLPEHRLVKIETGEQRGDYYFFKDSHGMNVDLPQRNYKLIGDFVRSMAHTEMTNPGTYKTWIPAFRDNLRNLQETDHAKVTCTVLPVTEGDDDYLIDTKKRLAAKHGTEPFKLDTVALLSDKYRILNGPVQFHIED